MLFRWTPYNTIYMVISLIELKPPCNNSDSRNGRYTKKLLIKKSSGGGVAIINFGDDYFLALPFPNYNLHYTFNCNFF